jgi:hypothetical protein
MSPYRRCRISGEENSNHGKYAVKEVVIAAAHRGKPDLHDYGRNPDHHRVTENRMDE